MRVTRSVLVDSGNRIRAVLAWGRRVVKIPNESVTTGLCGKDLRRADPVCRDVEFLVFHGFGLVRAGKAADQFLVGVEDFKGHRVSGLLLQKVIEGRAI